MSRMPEASRLFESKDRLLGFEPRYASSFFPLFIHRKYEDILKRSTNLFARRSSQKNVSITALALTELLHFSLI